MCLEVAGSITPSVEWSIVRDEFLGRWIVTVNGCISEGFNLEFCADSCHLLISKADRLLCVSRYIVLVGNSQVVNILRDGDFLDLWLDEGDSSLQDDSLAVSNECEESRVRVALYEVAVVSTEVVDDAACWILNLSAESICTSCPHCCESF